MPGPTVVIGTAGHIDHGKTSLLRALTGIDADRLPEERARGMTIDVGYAHLTFDDGVELDFVDVPGHDRLIGNMLVGAGEIDAAMLVVAADDGPRPQTLEHLQLLDALGTSAGLAVVTKIDVADSERVATVVAEITALLAGTNLASVPVLAASSVSGKGIDEVRSAIRVVRDAVLAGWAGPSGGTAARGPLRLAIDRAFAVKGRGAVATGSLRGGSLTPGAALRREPGGDAVRVREIQVHGQSRDRHEGGRTAVNVAGGAAGDLRRGQVLTSGAGIVGTDRLLVALRPPARLGAPDARPTKRSARLRLHAGTDQVDAVLRSISGTPSVAVLSLEREIASFAGDRALLREPASGAVVAGVRVLDPHPPRGVSRRRMTAERLTELVAAVESGDEDRVVAARTGLHGALPGSGELAEDVRSALEARAVDAVRAHHRDAPLSPGLPLPRARAGLLRTLRSIATVERRDADLAQATIAAVLESLVSSGRLARSGEALRDPKRAAALPPEVVESMSRLEAALSVAAPPPLDEAAAAAGCPPEGVRALAADGRIVRLGPDLAWSTPTYHRLAGLALERARVRPLTPAEFRDATGTSRRFVLAILEDLDRRGILQRTPEGHVPGPRAPRVRVSTEAAPSPAPTSTPHPEPVTRLDQVTAIVLAGGRSTRFGGSKLDAEIDGMTVLERAIEAVAGLAAGVVVAGPPTSGGGSNPPSDPSTPSTVRTVADDQPFEGPLAALAGVLSETSTELAVVVGGDMPALVPSVLEAMLARLGSDGTVEAVVLESIALPPADPSAQSGQVAKRQVLPLAVRVAPARAAAAAAIERGDRSIVRFLDRLRVVDLPAGQWLALDPAGRTLLDVDIPADLERILGSENL